MENLSMKYLRNLKNLLPGFQDIANTLMEKLDAECTNGYFEPQRWMSRATLDALGKCGFGMDFDALNGKMSEVYHAYEGLASLIANPLLLLDWFHKLPLPANKRVQQDMATFWKWAKITVHKQLAEMQKNPDREPNLLDSMINAHFAEESQLNEHELLHNIFVFFLAGHETTAGTLTFTLDALARHPDIQEKCREEVASLFQPGELPTYEKIKQLTYLNRVISETMRTQPLVAAISRQAKKDTTAFGYSIPKGTFVSSVISNLCFDPDIWDDPFTFNPDRWIEPSKSHSTPYFMPFGTGPRICLGMNFANLEMRTVLVNLLLRYKFGVKEDLVYERNVTLRPKAGYCLTISRI